MVSERRSVELSLPKGCGGDSREQEKPWGTLLG